MNFVRFLEIHAGFTKVLIDVAQDPCMPRSGNVSPDQVATHLADAHDVDPGVLEALTIAAAAWRRQDYSLQRE